MSLEIAKILIDIKSIKFSFDNHFTLTSGLKSPVYVDCRKIISYPNERNQILTFMENYINKNKIQFDLVAGGETAGIPYAAFLSERLNKPMIYIRKKPKGFGKNSLIEGDYEENCKCILIEDLATDGGSKVKFVENMRENNIKVNDTFVIFYYDTFKKEESLLTKLNINIHYLCSWEHILNEVKKEGILSAKDTMEVEDFLYNSN